MSQFESLMEALETGKNTSRMVQHQDGTESASPYVSANTNAQELFTDMEGRVDALYGAKPAYQAIKREKPEHRLMLWLKLNGHSTKEIASVTGYTDVHIRTICKQPWFIDAFCKLSTEAGKDAVQTYLEGEVMPALQRTVSLAQDSKIDAVKLAANREILDRFLGKPLAKTENKNTNSGTMTVVHDVAALQKEAELLDRRLAANGLTLFTPSRS